MRNGVAKPFVKPSEDLEDNYDGLDAFRARRIARVVNLPVKCCMEEVHSSSKNICAQISALKCLTKQRDIFECCKGL